MEIKQHCVVALTWVLQDTLGEELDVLEAPVEFLVGGQDLLGRIEEALQGHTAGDTLNLHLEPEEAFGDYLEQLLFLEPRRLFPEELEEGMVLEGNALPAGCSPALPSELLYTVTDIYPEHVVLDGNHPLAGLEVLGFTQFQNRQVFALARQRTVKINKMQPFGTAGRPFGSHLRRIIGKNSFRIKASLRQTHTASAADIYCRIYNHNFPLIIQQNFSAGACRLCSTFPDGTGSRRRDPRRDGRPSPCH